MVLSIAIVTWMLLICLTMCICCCNYWHVLRPPPAHATPLQCQYSQSENQHSSLLSLED
ncbi:uncharacterized protein Dwil_GK27351 [Drosophila willistoni]|uniref:Uncharacterized protein n=2 Tax=Drosophila willistoni TaxID=7260 RepID=A0A0Q9WQ31_DROWI|nr:uncharacterized protein Dwil_GK27351 [Drosophila willistoni]